MAAEAMQQEPPVLRPKGQRRLPLHQMDVQVVVGHFHPRRGKGIAQVLVQREESVPVVLRPGPAADAVLNGAAAVLRQIHHRRRLRQQ